MNKYAEELIKRFEGCKLTAYKDPVGIWTIGYGQTGYPITCGVVWTQKQADVALTQTVTHLEDKLSSELPKPLSDTKMGALLDFAYNLGVSALLKSTMWRKLLDGQTDLAVASEFLKWNRAGGKVLPGLTARRQAEHDLYLS